MRFRFAAIVLAQACALAAQATPVTTIDWSLHDAAETAAFRLQGRIERLILFVVADATQVSSTVSSDQSLGASADKGGVVALFKEGGDIDALIGSYDFDSQSASVAYLFDLQPGSYYYRIARSGPGSNGGTYAINSLLGARPAGLVSAAVSAVSEPPGIFLVLAALAASAWVKLRRRPHAPAESQRRRRHHTAHHGARRLVL